MYLYWGRSSPLYTIDYYNYTNNLEFEVDLYTDYYKWNLSGTVRKCMSLGQGVLLLESDYSYITTCMHEHGKYIIYTHT